MDWLYTQTHTSLKNQKVESKKQKTVEVEFIRQI
jgi:hypothetical protein